MLSYQDTKRKGRKKKKEIDGYFARAAKALVVSELIAIFYPGDGKSWLAGWSQGL